MAIVKNQQQQDLICCVCGNINTILRSEARNLRIFTSINRYCYKCKKQTLQIYIENITTARFVLEQTPYLSRNQQIVLKLIGKEEYKIK